jgi:hypothetical protein
MTLGEIDDAGLARRGMGDSTLGRTAAEHGRLVVVRPAKSRPAARAGSRRASEGSIVPRIAGGKAGGREGTLVLGAFEEGESREIG